MTKTQLTISGIPIFIPEWIGILLERAAILLGKRNQRKHIEEIKNIGYSFDEAMRPFPQKVGTFRKYRERTPFAGKITAYRFDLFARPFPLMAQFGCIKMNEEWLIQDRYANFVPVNHGDLIFKHDKNQHWFSNLHPDEFFLLYREA